MADHGKYQGDKGLEYYKAYPRDFFEGTLGFDGPLKGFYRMVIDLIYMHDGFLLDDWGHIAGHTGFGITKCKRFMAQLIEKGKIFEEIDKDSRYFVNRRSKVELSASRKFQKKQANNSAARWENNGLADPTDDPAHIPPQDHKTTRQESPSDSVDPEKKSIFGGQEKKPPKPKPKPERFEEFWNEAYPHRGGAKRGKAASLKKYEAAILRGVPEATIIDGARDFQRDRKTRDGFAPDPATWLHGECWADDIDTGGTAGGVAPQGDEADQIRHKYLSSVASQMKFSAGNWVVGSRFVSNRDLSGLHELGLMPEVPQ